MSLLRFSGHSYSGDCAEQQCLHGHIFLHTAVRRRWAETSGPTMSWTRRRGLWQEIPEPSTLKEFHTAGTRKCWLEQCHILPEQARQSTQVPQKQHASPHEILLQESPCALFPILSWACKHVFHSDNEGWRAMWRQQQSIQ